MREYILPGIHRSTASRTVRAQGRAHRAVRAVLPALALLFLALLPPVLATAGAMPRPAGAPTDPTISVSPGGPASPADPAHPERAREAQVLARALIPPAHPGPATAPPRDLRHVGDWIAYRTAHHLASLPAEARIFYRRGLLARLSNQDEEALINVRGAAELDPTFVEPHLTLAAWMLLREPAQAVQQYGNVLALVRQNFRLQLELVTNAVLIGFDALFAGLLFAAMILVWLHRDELTHVWREDLQRLGATADGRLWTPLLVLAPLAAGFGFTLPTLALMGHLWPTFRVRERTVFVLLLTAVLAAPFVRNVTSRLALPLAEDAPPLFALPSLENAPWTPATEQHLAALAAANPANAIAHFGLGWAARRGGHLDVAEKAYRRVVEIWPRNDRALTDLGNVLAIEGRTDEALTFYRRAIDANPANAAAYFNTSQIHTQHFDYQAASDALSRASALDFEMVRQAQAQATTDGLLPLIDQWLEPAAFWTSLRGAVVPADLAGGVPIGFRGHVEASGWRFSILALLFAGMGLAAGIWQHRRVHLRTCSNCGTVLCRRCAQRRRELALCSECAEMESRAETADFGRVLLMRRRQDRRRSRQFLHTALATLIPGYGMLAHRRAATPVFVLALSWVLVRLWAGSPPPFALVPRLTPPGQEVPFWLLMGATVVVYAISLVSYLRLAAVARRREEAIDAAQRGRVAQATRRVLPVAA